MRPVTPAVALLRAGSRLLILLLSAAGLARPLRAQTITEFQIPSAGSVVDSIAAGPDGNVWFNEGTVQNTGPVGVNKIARITPAGVVTEFPIPTANGGATGMVAGPDGNMWFSELITSKVGRITPSGAIAEFATPTANSTPFVFLGPDGNVWIGEIAVNKVVRINQDGTFTEISLALNLSNIEDEASGPDGNFWLTNGALNQIHRVTTNGSVTTFGVPTANAFVREIAAGPDGNMWFVEQNAGKIGRITTAGVITEFTIPTANSAPRDPVAGPDGRLWFVETNTNKIGRITTAGVVTEFSIPTPGNVTSPLTVGPDGNIWFGETAPGGVGKIARITPAGVITEFTIPTHFPSTGGEVGAMTAGPDGNMWFSEIGTNKIGRVNLSGGTCVVDSTTLCLNAGRFKVQAQYTTAAGSPPMGETESARSSGPGQAVALTADTGYFWFFSASNVEVIIKAVDGTAINGKYWVFAAGLTNVNVVITVTDTKTGTVKNYINPQGTAFQPIQDTSAFATTPDEAVRAQAGVPAVEATTEAIAAELSALLASGAVEARGADPLSGLAAQAVCVPDATTLCLNAGRFQVRVAWTTSDNRSGSGQAVALTSDTGYFWFFSSNNVEMIIKVVSGCALNSRYWVFAGGLTNVNVVITVTDTLTGAVKTYTNPQGTAFQPIQDTSAFASCS